MALILADYGFSCTCTYLQFTHYSKKRVGFTQGSTLSCTASLAFNVILPLITVQHSLLYKGLLQHTAPCHGQTLPRAVPQRKLLLGSNAYPVRIPSSWKGVARAARRMQPESTSSVQAIDHVHSLRGTSWLGRRSALLIGALLWRPPSLQRRHGEAAYGVVLVFGLGNILSRRDRLPRRTLCRANVGPAVLSCRLG